MNLLRAARKSGNLGKSRLLYGPFPFFFAWKLVYGLARRRADARSRESSKNGHCSNSSPRVWLASVAFIAQGWRSLTIQSTQRNLTTESPKYCDCAVFKRSNVCAQVHSSCLDPATTFACQQKRKVLGCGSFVRGRKRKKGDSIPFILSRRDYMSRLHEECPQRASTTSDKLSSIPIIYIPNPSST